MGDDALVSIHLGPVPVAAASAWLVDAERTMAVLRDTAPIDIPGDVTEVFGWLLAEWRTVADAGPEEFRWSGRLALATIRRVATHWAMVASASRTEGVDLQAPPIEAKPFYEALIDAIGRALAAETNADGVGDVLVSALPGFEATISPSPSTSRRRCRVLLVDDTADIRFLLRLGLERHPDLVIVGEAADGLEALEQAAAAAPDAIVLDWSMPRMSGEEVLPRLRQVAPDARIVVFSATVEARRRALAAGAHAFVDKGTDPDTLAAVLLGVSR